MKKTPIIGLSLILVFLISALGIKIWLPERPPEPLIPPEIAMLIQGELGGQTESPGKIQDALRILFVGDTSFGENYHNDDFYESIGYNYSLRKVTKLLNSSDMVIANLETPLTDISKSPLDEKKQYIHWSDINKAPVSLRDHNIKYVSLANNHTMDYSAEGLLQTMITLQKNGIIWFGAGLNSLQAARPLHADFLVNEHPFNLVVASGFEYRTRYNWMYHFYAGENCSGVNRWKNRDAKHQIREIRQANQDAFIVAFPHWGDNYKFRSGKQTKLAHSLIEAGSDLVIGHGAHMLQEIEYYRGKWILYSLGNFILNSPGRYQKLGAAPFSLAASLDVVEKAGELGLALHIYPIFSDNRISNYQPRLVTKEELSEVEEIILQHSPDSDFLQEKLQTREDKIGFFFSLELETSEKS